MLHSTGSDSAANPSGTLIRDEIEETISKRYSRDTVYHCGDSSGERLHVGFSFGFNVYSP